MAHTTRTRLQDRPSLPSRATRVGHGPSGRAKPLQERRVDLDLLAGALAGAAAVWVMDRVDWFNYRRGLDDERTRRQTRRARPRGMDPAHVLAAQATEAVGVAMSSRQLHRAGLAVHYGLGALPGALYGTLRGRRAPALRRAAAPCPGPPRRARACASSSGAGQRACAGIPSSA